MNGPENDLTEREARAAAERDAAADQAADEAGYGGEYETARVVELEAQLAETTEKWKRALAETENVRRIAARDREDASKYAVSKFARDLLSVADNLRRALESVDEDARESDANLDAVAGGVELTERELQATLARHGITPIEAAAQPFDPHVHEALFEVPDESVAHGTVVHVLEPGYMIHDRTLRPARVGVSKGGPKPGARPTDAEAGRDIIDFPADGGAEAYDKRSASEGPPPGSEVDEKL